MDNIWNVILHNVDENNQLVNPQNNPKESGRYLCTCVNFYYGEEQNRYLQVMEYDVKKNYWHDCGHANGISHNILAWTDKISPCLFTDFTYLAGGYFLEK